MNVKESYLILGVTAVVSLGLGAISGFLFARKQLETKYDEMAVNEIAALAVSEEPAGGSPHPTTAPAWVAQLH